MKMEIHKRDNKGRFVSGTSSHSEETKQKISNSIKEWHNTREQWKPWNKGKKMTVEQKQSYIDYWTKIKVAKGQTATSKIRKTLELKYGIKWEDMYLPEDPVIHHIDGDRTNNSFENLCVMSREDHSRFHCTLGGN